MTRRLTERDVIADHLKEWAKVPDAIAYPWADRLLQALDDNGFAVVDRDRELDYDY